MSKYICNPSPIIMIINYVKFNWIFAHYKKYFFKDASAFAQENVSQNSTSSTSSPITTEMESDSPITAYKKRIALGQLQRDDYQMTVVERLQGLYNKIDSYEPPSGTVNWISKVVLIEYMSKNCFFTMLLMLVHVHVNMYVNYLLQQ